jgi:glucose-1-phosphate cytidylyltransferase
MKAVILAGGLGTRLSEETESRPKPMVEIGGKPILWHIMKLYAHHGVSDFIICCGYKGYVIKEYFANYFLHNSDITFDLKNNEMQVHGRRGESWSVTLVDTGEATMTGGRLLRVADWLSEEENFCLTYGDGLADINITETIEFHREHGRIATVTAVKPESRFGVLEIENRIVSSFIEKPESHLGLINGGFFVLSSDVFKYLGDDNTVFEDAPLRRLATDGQLMSYRHDGFWQPMDTLRDRYRLEGMWSSGSPPWRLWAAT